MTDHIAQYVQRYVFGIWPAPALFQGLLNATDTTVHLWLNGIEYVAFIVLWFSFKESKIKESINTKLNPTKLKHLLIATYAILFLVIFQTLHVIDHIVQYVQLYTLGIDPAPGVFQGLFSETDTVVHLWVNGAMILAVFVIWASLNALERWKIVKPVVFIDEDRIKEDNNSRLTV
ncbi:MAG: hypothetical protein ACRD32_03270 [Nitrososphaerales archaeon]